MTRSDLAARVHAAVARLEPGEVVTYGELAEELGRPGAARAVGAAMRTCPDGLPWWRVVPASGRLPAHLVARQAPLLVAEGVVVVDGRVRSGNQPRG
jgi:methylated-DNA-protein-cysteine methyltransferase-like protein